MKSKMIYRFITGLQHYWNGCPLFTYIIEPHSNLITISLNKKKKIRK